MTLQFQQAVNFHRNLPEDLWFALEGCGIPSALIHARLIGWDGEQITIPVFSRDRKVVAFEYASFDEQGRLALLPQEGERSYLYGEPVMNLSPSEVVLTEGVVESLVLSSQGFNALSATGDGLSFREEWASALRKARGCFICFKRHAESIGSALIVRDLVPGARIVTLPPEVGHGGGLYEFFVELGQSPADFRALLRRAADSPDA
ncbi:MAG TPA: hypothetical protein VF121_05210 [Thermoanaerobaculia bacterium]|nr:hypothetical protein [Thermoanaerobaculia bacterium]